MLDEFSSTLPTRECSFQEIPPHLHAAAVLSRRGDTKIIWDRTKPEEVEAARAMFNDLKKKNYLAFRVTDSKGEKGDQIREFDPDVERMVFTPQMKAG